MEKSPEIGIGHNTTPAREIDARNPRWWSVDPKNKQYPSLSPYVSMNNSPLVIVDKKGKSGELIFQPNPTTGQQEVVLQMDLYFYGNAADPITVMATAMYVQNAWNEIPSTMAGPDGNQYPFRVEIKGVPVTSMTALDLAQKNVGANFDPKMNFVRLENLPNSSARNTESEVLGLDRNFNDKANSNGADNSMRLPVDKALSTASSHELIHFLLPRSDLRAHITQWSDNPNPTTPSIRATRFTKGIPLSLGLHEVGPLGGSKSLDGSTWYPTMDISKRKVFPADKNLISRSPATPNWSSGQPPSIPQSVHVGNSTNTLFNSQGNEVNSQKATTLD